MSDFHIKLYDLQGSQIAAFALRKGCRDCGASARQHCKGKTDTVCRSRFVSAVKELADIGEEAILQAIGRANVRSERAEGFRPVDNGDPSAWQSDDFGDAPF